MQPAKKVEHDFSANIIDFKTKMSVRRQKMTMHNETGEKTCFRTPERYFCKDTECSCWNECKKLVAEWMR